MDLRPTCGHCKCAMDMANIRANPSGSGFICRTCLEAKTGKSQAAPVTRQEVNDFFAKKQYLCEDCGYTFERNATFVVDACPMCSKEEVHEMMFEDASYDDEQEIIFQ